MPEKISPYATYGEKLIRLFAKLLFSGQSYSLTELSRMLRCSKQTVLRLLDDIRRSYGVEIKESLKGRSKFYSMKKTGRVPPALNLSRSEMEVLLMCQAFARHLLGDSLFKDASTAIEKNQALLGCSDTGPRGHFTYYLPGSIDYTAHELSIRTLLKAMEDHTICRVAYKSISSQRAKRFFIMPLKIFSHNDTMYLSARYAGKPGHPEAKAEFDPLLAVHRIQAVDLTDKTFEFPADYDFEKTYNNNFGIIKKDAFMVEALFTGHASRYVSERIWSPDQKILKQGKDSIRIILSASSVPELKAWILSFGDEARLIRPEWLLTEIRETIHRMKDDYEIPVEPSLKDVDNPR